MMDGDIEADDGAIAPPHDGSLRDVQSIHQRNHITRHQVISDGFGIESAAAMTTAIDHDHFKTRGKRRDLKAPIIRIGEAAVQENYGRSLTKRGVPEADAIHRHRTTSLRFG